jgi:CRP/FNR family transcriptional regulator
MPNASGPAFAPGRQIPIYCRLVKPLPCLRCPVKGFNVCKPLDYDRQKELFELGLQQTWKRRQFIFRAGDPLAAVFKITSGIVAVSKPLADGRRQILDFFLPGEICGFLQTDGKYAFDGEAMTEVKTCSFNRRRFDSFVAAHHDVADAIKTALEEKLHQASQHMAVIGQLSSTERVANFLCTLGVAYSEHVMQTRPLSLPMKRTDIADYLGLRLETVSRAFSKLKRRGILELNDDEIIINDPASLARLSGV